MNLKFALILSCVVTYTNSQQHFDVPTPQEQREASSINSFKKPGNSRPINTNDLPTPTQRVQSSDISPPQQQPIYSNLYNNYNNGINQPVRQPIETQRFGAQGGGSPFRPVVNRPQILFFPGQNPIYQQTVVSRAPIASSVFPQQPVVTFLPAPPSSRLKPSIQTQRNGNNYAPVTQFAWRLFKAANIEGQNFVSCPLSPQLLLSYLVSGSEGETKQELTNVVGYENTMPLTQLIRDMLTSGSNRQLQIATSFFVSDKLRLNPRFQSTATDNDVEIVPTNFYNPDDFSQVYNRWVRSKTKGTFSATRAVMPAQTKMIMSSAVYFKGDWVYKFNPAQKGTFYYAPGNSMPANMMTLRKKLQYGTLGNMAEWVSIPYNSSDSMIVILPNQGFRVDDVVRDLKISDLFDTLNHADYANVNLTLPKFKLETKKSLIEPFQRMGINKIFSPSSQLIHLTENGEPVHISNAIQQASMEVNEEGSIASALTTFSVVALSFASPTPEVEFKVDRPFIAMIVDRRNNFPFFVTKVVAPQ